MYICTFMWVNANHTAHDKGSPNIYVYVLTSRCFPCIFNKYTDMDLLSQESINFCSQRSLRMWRSWRTKKTPMLSPLTMPQTATWWTMSHASSASSSNLGWDSPWKPWRTESPSNSYGEWFNCNVRDPCSRKLFICCLCISLFFNMMNMNSDR